MSASPSKGGGGESLTVEKMYQKKSQMEHILLRPDTYIGSVEFVQEMMWVYDKEQQMMVQREINYVPGLYKIFDEILVNAADNKQRDPKMDCIKIDINAESNTISVWNNGKGIPVVEHKDEKMFVPTMIFGHLLTSSNYNDEEEKVTGGRNGYGAKLCNIFSTKFMVETSSKEYKRAFKQTWTDNMSKAMDVKIRDAVGEDYTKISFSPDLSKFRMEKLDDDIVSLFFRRAFDIAASTRGVKVFLNGEKLPVKSFKDYIDLYIKNKEDDTGSPLKIIYENVNPRWEVALTTSDKGFQQVSFVNSIATTKGGRHVDYVADALTKQLIEVLKKKNKGGMAIKPFQIKSHMWLFINCLIVNPTFDSQTKEHMTLQSKSFGSKCQLSEKFMTQVSKSGIIEQVLTWAKFKQQTQLEKTGGKKKMKLKGIPKLEDANDAGSKNSLGCTLILTEGDSAKSLAVSGLGVVGRDKYGVFPLRGKLLNVREATHKQILENAEINNIIKIMGLQYKKKYESVDDLKTLRYGKLMIMTDQDQDGSHIKGLIVNFIHHNWPSLIKMNFLEVFITPIIKATKRNEEMCFYSIPEFDEWKNETPNWSTYRIKYYKGLGTSTSKEAKEYFMNMERHRIQFRYSGPECDQHIIMAFSKKCVDQRKEWLTNWMAERKRRKELGLPEEYLYMKHTKYITYKDFINKELVLFSNMDNERSIPSMVDGLKPGSRKVLFTCLKRNDKREIKVAQLAGSVAEHSAYHHGEQSLMMTIINLAQNFVGSNNINLLQPIGQFGTRLQGGKDAASPRYIFTMLSPLTRLIFHPHDDPLLKYLKDDNQKIEPFWYIPIIPMVLVNGADGIGTGWMTKIPNFNPREIITNLRKLINGSDDVSTMKPWYKNFRGEIDFLVEGRFVVNGEVSMLDDDRIEITELPVGTWTQNYKETVLEVMLNGSEKNPAMITDFKEYNTDTTVRFVVSMSRDKYLSMEREGFHKAFKLQTTLSTSSMCVFDRDGCLKKFASVKDILKEYHELRMEYYVKRKAYLEGMLEAEANKLSNQARFILEKCSNKLTIENKKKIKMIEELQSKGYLSDPVKAWKLKQQEEEEEENKIIEEKDEEEDNEPVEKGGPDYDYLLGMTMWTLTLEKKEELLNKKNAKVAELEALKMKTPGEIWLDDLDILSAKLDEVEEKERLEESGQPTKGVKLGKGKKKAMADEVLPSRDGIRIEPAIGAELKKKAETAVRLKEKKLLKGPKKDKESGEKDEFDLIEEGAQKSITARLGNSPSLIDKKIKKEKKMKQSKLDFKKKDNPWSDSEDSEDGFNRPVKAEPSRKSSRQSVGKIKYDFGSDDEVGAAAFSSDSDNETPPKTMTKMSDSEDEKPKKAAAPKKKAISQQSSAANSVVSSDSELDFKPKSDSKPADNSNDLFDSLITSNNSKPKSKRQNDSSDDEFQPSDDEKPKKGPKKAAAAKPKKPAAPKEPKQPKAKKEPKAAAPKKRTKKAASDSDSDDMFTISAKSKTKKKKANSSDEEEIISLNDSFDTPIIKTSSRRGKEPVSYKFDDNDESDF